MPFKSGRHFLQIPGPSNVPDRVLRAMDQPTIDHRSREAADLALACIHGMRVVFQTEGAVLIYPGSGTGAWEAALVNTLSPGDRVLTYETGHFSTLWTKVARNLGLTVEYLPGDWRHAADTAAIRGRLAEDHDRGIKAVMLVHNETSTGISSDVAAVRRALDETGHPALLLVDTVSSLGSMEYRHDEWGVDVAVAASQKGLMLPPGLAFNAVSAKAIAASKASRMPKNYWRWEDMLSANTTGFFPFTPATNLLFGLRESLRMLEEEGLENVFRRHVRLAEATRRAVRAWGLELLALEPSERSQTVTAVLLPDGYDEAGLRGLILDRFNLSLGAGLGKVAGRVFRIGHLGSFNELMLAGALAGVEMGLALFGVPHTAGGVGAALAYLAEQVRTEAYDIVAR
jgi:alanine-glyoxylate transaminase / serine-glyoxylate transaminase / serine-pyruvate transaminase